MITFKPYLIGEAPQANIAFPKVIYNIQLFNFISNIIVAPWHLTSLASRLFTQRFVQAHIKEKAKLRVAGLCEGKPPVTGDFPHKAQ